MAVDYYPIQEALANLIKSAAPNDIKHVFIEAMDKDLILSNFPCANVRLVSEEEELRSIPNGYYNTLNYEVDVMAYDLTHFAKAAILRDTLLGQIKDAIRAAKQFHSGMETSSIVPLTRFGALSPEGAGGHVALATFTVRCEVNIEAT